jgi:hypothetical protein
VVFHVCLLQPEGYIHSGAFYELAELIALGLHDLGHDCAVQLNSIHPDARNILIGCHLLNPAHVAQLPTNTIVLNTEQVFENESPFSAKVLDWARRFEIWDYSPRNREWLVKQGAQRIHLLGIGYHPSLHRIARKEQDIDVLFYGSLNERRTAMLEQLRQAGLVVQHLFGVYGSARDEWIARSKVVLNLHYYDSKIFEIVRVHYLMNNAKAVVGEVGPDTVIDPRYLGGFLAADYDGLVEACLALCRDGGRRSELEQQALRTLSALPQSAIMAGLVEAS